MSFDKTPAAETTKPPTASSCIEYESLFATGARLIGTDTQTLAGLLEVPLIPSSL